MNLLDRNTSFTKKIFLLLLSTSLIAAAPALGLVISPAAHANPTLYLPYQASNSYLVTQYPHAGQGQWNEGAADIALPTGTPVLASAPGKVSASGWFTGNGITVLVDHGNNYCTQYIHLSKAQVKVGQQVGQGEQVALSGNTGNSTGPHLHWNTVSCNSQVTKGNAVTPAEYPRGLYAGLKATSKNQSAFTVGKSVGSRYHADGGEATYGKPRSAEIPVKDGGVHQVFDQGLIYWKQSTGAWPVWGGMLAAYAAQGFENGNLGFPTSEENPIRNGGIYQTFEGGTLYWNPAMLKAFPVRGEMLSAYGQNGYENGYLGYPTGNEVSLRDGGKVQAFQGGLVYWNPATRKSHVAQGGMLAAYAAQGFEGGTLGYPTSEENPIRNGGIYQTFDGGTLYWNPGMLKAFPLQGDMLSTYGKNGYENGYLGYPNGSEMSLRNGGKVQAFQGGLVYWNPGTRKSHVAQGGMLAAYAAQGFEGGTLGYPTGEETPLRNGGISQTYDGGTLYWNPARLKAYPVQSDMLSAYRQNGLENGALGYPTGIEASLRDGGKVQAFQGGLVYWNPGSRNGYMVRGDMLFAYDRTGFENGALGYPTGNEARRDGNLSQSFEKGTLIYQLSDGSFRVEAPQPQLSEKAPDQGAEEPKTTENPKP